MNLGTTVLKTVNSSKPVLSRTTTAHSVAASSDEYFSLSEYATESSSSKTPVTVIRYETPPMQKVSSPTPRETQESEMTLPRRPQAIVPAPLNVRFSKTRSTRHIPSETTAKSPEDVSPPTPNMDDRPFIRFAIDQLTRDEELTGQGRQGSITSTDYPVQRIIPDEGLGYYKAPAAAQSQQPRKQPPLEPLPDQTLRAPSPERLIAVEDVPISCPDTGYIPRVLRPTSILITILTILFMIAALIFCNLWSSQHSGLWDYTSSAYEGRYFVFQYLPQLLGIILIIWLFVIQASIRRTIPFLKLSGEKPADRVLQDLAILPANFVTPNLTYFGGGEKVMGLCEITFWFMNFTIPLLSCAFQTKLYTINGDSTWRWTTVQSVVWVVVGMYILLILVLVLVMVRFSTRYSALCWDPVSIADLVSIFQRSNILADYDRSEISGSMKTHIPARFLRLGYWKTSRSKNIFYTVGEESGPMRRYSLDRKGYGEKSAMDPGTPPWDVEAQRYSNASSFVRNIHSPFIRYRWAPWFLRDSAVIVWVVTALVLWIAFVVVSFLKHAVQYGFAPLLPTTPNAEGFSPSNFLYSFLPALLGMFLFLAWQPIDLYFRAAQPFYSLSHPRGTTAEESLLLGYPSCMPIEITVLAFASRHFKVAWISLIALLSGAIPVLAGGVFMAEYYPLDDAPRVRMTADMSAYYLLTVILFFYTISFLIIWPTRRRYLPHRIDTLADILSFVYQSGMLRDTTFRQPQSKADLVARLVTIPPGEGEALTGGPRKPPRYAFGIYVGRDGREHLGIDRLQRPGSGEMLITMGKF